jgi:tRNA G18 (ribose-2'-O)-methylase SpoU
LKQEKLPKKQEIYIWFGNEIHGVSSQTIANCKYELHLPMKGMKESLNVANCATTVGYLFQAFK